MATLTTTTYSVGDLVASTLINSRQELVDNIFKKSAYLAKMMLAGRKKTDSGGIKINRSVEYGVNGTVQSFQGYDVVPIVPQETVTDTQWDWKEYAGNWVISRREERLNTGKAKFRDLAGQKKSSLERSFNEQLNTHLLNPASFTTVGNSGKDLTPLTMLVSAAALTVGSVNESAAGNGWWANQRLKSITSNQAAGTVDGSKFVNELRSFYNTCGQNNDGFPDFCLWSKDVYETYMAVLDSKVRYGSTEMANLGFQTVMLFGAEVAWDQIVPRWTVNAGAQVAYSDATGVEGSGFFLNTDYIYLMVDSGTDFVMTTPVSHEPGGQYATSGSLLFMGEHLVTNRRSMGNERGINCPAVKLTT